MRQGLSAILWLGLVASCGDSGSSSSPSDLSGTGKDLGPSPLDASSTVGVSGAIGCGSYQCPSIQYCCLKSSGVTCGSDDGFQCYSTGGKPLFCDSSASCQGNDICCFNNGNKTTNCLPNCTNPDFQVCNPNHAGECVTGNCKLNTGPYLPAGYYSCQ
jgi:hypothetical protein